MKHQYRVCAICKECHLLLVTDIVMDTASKDLYLADKLGRVDPIKCFCGHKIVMEPKTIGFQREPRGTGPIGLKIEN